jgi:hypothetical protein
MTDPNCIPLWLGLKVSISLSSSLASNTQTTAPIEKGGGRWKRGEESHRDKSSARLVTRRLVNVETIWRRHEK